MTDLVKSAATLAKSMEGLDKAMSEMSATALRVKKERDALLLALMIFEPLLDGIIADDRITHKDAAQVISALRLARRRT